MASTSRFRYAPLLREMTVREIRWSCVGWAVWFLGLYFIPTPDGMHWVDWFLLAAVAWQLALFAWSFRRVQPQEPPHGSHD